MKLTSQIEFRELRISDLQEIVAIENEHMQDPSICLRSSPNDIAKSLLSGMSFGALLNGNIIAYSLCYDNEYRLGFVEKCFVHPAYRGNGFQSSLLMMNMVSMRNRGIINAYAMASPSNAWSLRNFKIRGFDPVGEAQIQGYKRLILRNGN